MWIARDKGMNGSEGRLRLFVKEKPARHIYYDKWTVLGGNAYGPMGECPHGYCIDIESNMFPNLKWEDEPIEVGLIELNATDGDPIDDTIVLTRYYEDYEKEHERFVNMLKHQERYKDCTDEEVEEIWKDHITEIYTFDEIWSTIQCEGYTKIALRMGRHDVQPDYDYVLETKEYIDEKMKKYL